MKNAFICEGVRTPIGRFGGSLSNVRTDDLAAHPLKELRARFAGSDWAAIDEVILGCVNQAGEDNRNVARMASLLADIPDSVPGLTVNRLCASGLEAVAAAYRAIAVGDIQLAIAGGVENMTRAPFVMAKANKAFSRDAQIFDSTIGWRFVNPAMVKKYGTEGMPETAENVAEKYGIDRAAQDAFSWRSQQRAAAAQASGFFAGEIVGVPIAGPKGSSTLFSVDEHPRASTTLEQLAALATPFRTNGTVTAGNSSGVNDGACALFVASEEAAARFGLTPVARILGAVAAGVSPSLMGIGPIPAITKLMAQHKLSIKDFSVIELNEAFAAQSLAVAREFGLPDDYELLNPNGGAIALGHPLGMSGARLVLTASRQLASSGGRYALCTMCVGVGQGAALIMERV